MNLYCAHGFLMFDCSLRFSPVFEPDRLFCALLLSLLLGLLLGGVYSFSDSIPCPLVVFWLILFRRHFMCHILGYIMTY